MCTDFRERERDRNIDVREKHPLVTSHMHPNRGSNPQTFRVWDDAPTNRATQVGQTKSSCGKKYIPEKNQFCIISLWIDLRWESST